ncbi:MAG TPA: hypothetical protein VF549_18820 [Solirubrobacteraceae bacterium]
MHSWLDVAVDEYRALRAGEERRHVRQRVTLALGLVAMGVLLALGMSAESGSLRATVALVVGVPLVAVVVAALWGEEENGIVVTRIEVERLRKDIAARFPGEPAPIGARSDPGGIGFARMYGAAAVVLLAVSLGAAAIGLERLASRSNDYWWLWFLVPVTLAAGCVTLLRERFLAVRLLVDDVAERARGVDVGEAFESGARLVLPARTTAAAKARDLDERHRLLAEAGFSRASEVGGTRRAAQLVEDGRAFAVDWTGDLVFPRFQFDAGGEPRPVISEVIAAAGGPNRLLAWDMLLWFSNPSPYLDGRRPADAVAEEPEAVGAAARAELGSLVG